MIGRSTRIRTFSTGVEHQRRAYDSLPHETVHCPIAHLQQSHFMSNLGSPRSYAFKLALTEKSIPNYQDVRFLTSINSLVVQQETG